MAHWSRLRGFCRTLLSEFIPTYVPEGRFAQDL